MHSGLTCLAPKAQVTKLQMRIQCNHRVIKCIVYNSVPELFLPLRIFSFSLVVCSHQLKHLIICSISEPK